MGINVIERLFFRGNPRALSEKYFSEGVSAYRRGELGNAAARFQRAVELNPKNEIFHFYLGAALEAQGDLENAELSLRQALSLDPEFSAAQELVGLVYAQMWQKKGAADVSLHEKALESYRKVLEKDPENRDAMQFLHALGGTINWRR